MSNQQSFVYAVNDVNDANHHVEIPFVSTTAHSNTPLIATNAAINEVLFDIPSSTDDEEETEEADIQVPDWNNLNITEIYIQLNPYTQAEKIYQRGWRKKVVDCNGKPLHSVGVVGNQLLKKLVTRKLIPNIPLNIKLPTRKGDRLSQLEYLRTMINDNVNQLSFVRKFLCDNIMVSINGDGEAEKPHHININLQARIIMLANDPSSCAILEEILLSQKK
jgi:hypothetical protein